MKNIDWFRNAKFGMFIHWGLYSLLKRGEWVMHQDGIPADEYAKLANELHPNSDCAREWARLAKRAGMKYVVFTTKHHDGFALFDTRLSDFNSMKFTGRDFVREVVDAFRAEDIKVGLYFSLGDWHEPAYAAVGGGDVSRQDELRDFIHGQVRELMTNYGKIDLLWYDGAFYDGKYLSADTIDAVGLNAMARALQPEILINERAGTIEDYVTCENECKPAPYGTDWEMCTCINDIWGYCEHDYNYKTVNQLIFMLTNCAVQGGNLLLNISPRGDGSIPETQIERLEAVGKWLDLNGESVYGIERMRTPFFGGGRITMKDGKYYLHTYYWPGNTIRVPCRENAIFGGITTKIDFTVSILSTGQPVNANWEDDVLVITGLPENPPDQSDTVIVLSPI
jgi:alpha-L-fucosidase